MFCTTEYGSHVGWSISKLHSSGIIFQIDVEVPIPYKIDTGRVQVFDKRLFQRVRWARGAGGVGHLHGNDFSFHRIIPASPVAISPNVKFSPGTKGYGIVAGVIGNSPGVIVVKGLLPFPDNAGDLLTLECAAGIGGCSN